jgi:hypothetical protein
MLFSNENNPLHSDRFSPEVITTEPSQSETILRRYFRLRSGSLVRICLTFRRVHAVCPYGICFFWLHRSGLFVAFRFPSFFLSPVGVTYLDDGL